MPKRPRQVVLIGGGHAHVQVLKGHMMDPLPDAEITVVVDRSVAVYSGMVPGYVAGQYQRHELEIDVRPLARLANVRVIEAAATRIDKRRKRVHLDGRPSIPFDLLSINIGSTVAGQDTPGVRAHAIPSRPIATLLDRLDQAAGEHTEPEVVVVGGGAGGVELAFCTEARLRAEGKQPKVTLVAASSRLLAGRAQRISDRVLREAEHRGIAIRCNTRVTEVHADGVTLSDGTRLPSDMTLWVTGAVSHPLFEASGFETDERGFAWVDKNLQVQRDIYAAGDCAVLRHWPEVPKAGVYAVREGPVLLENLRATLQRRSPQPYLPQKDFLTLLNLGDGNAIGAKWGQSAGGKAAMAYKDRIDRAFMNKFQVLDEGGLPRERFMKRLPPRMQNMPEMRCGGCAAKVGPRALDRVLGRLPAPPKDATVQLGLEEREDVAAVGVGQHTLAANVDLFPAFTDDPWLVGRVGANNAMSDLFAKGVRPQWAMALVTLPEHSDTEELLKQVLRGARLALDAANVSLVGGHSTVGSELQVGFSVFGATTKPLWRGTPHPGDQLLLTRPLGSGVLLHADGMGRAPSRWVRPLFETLVQSNLGAMEALQAVEVHAATDVTGFGLLGHLLTLLPDDRAARLDRDAIPLYDGAVTLVENGERSTFHDQNLHFADRLGFGGDARFDDPVAQLLFDPQTAGGLLVSVPFEQADAALVALRALDPRAACIGTINARPDPAQPQVRLVTKG